ncbi:MAG: CPBP family intramembrane glutamic endopeptidase [Gammaproteobacteria bacterium]
MPDRIKLPGIWIGIAILAALFGLELVIGAAFYDFWGGFRAGDPAAIGVVTVLAYGIVFTVVLRVTGLTYPELFHAANTSVLSVVILLSLPISLVTIGANWWFVDLCNLIVPVHSVSQAEYDMMVQMIQGGVVSFISVGVVGPVLEEMLFRGVLLRGFLQHYDVLPAIFLSATVFAIFHFTLSQLPVAFGIGCFLGWLYWRTRSLWPCILAHATYNLTVLVTYAHSSDTRVQSMDPGWSEGGLAIDALSFLVSAAGFVMLSKILRSESRS